MGQLPTTTTPVFRNVILSSLPAEEMARLRPNLTRVRLPNGQVLHRPGERIEQLFFVEQGFVSMVTDADGEDNPVEVGLIGRESMVGLNVVLGPNARSYNRAMVQHAGIAYSIPTATVLDGFDRTPELRRLMTQQLEVMLAQIAQTAACNGRHLLDQRLARWLLMAHDRIEGDELALTQSFLAIMLAVRRSGVTIAVQSLQASGLVKHSRGRILISDRPGLEAASCRCYLRVREFAASFQS